MGGFPLTLSFHRLRYWSMAAIIMASHTGPQPMDVSPMLAITMPSWRLISLNSAEPVAMPAEPPTMALFGIEPKGN